MKLVYNWPDILKRAWSIKFIILAGILSGLEVFLPLIDQVVVIPRGVFAGLSGFVGCLAFIARIVVQKDLPED